MSNSHTFLVPEKLIGEAQRRVDRAIATAKRHGRDWAPTLTVGKPEFVAVREGFAKRVPITLTFDALQLNENFRLLAKAHVLNPGKNGRSADDVRDQEVKVQLSCANGVHPPHDAWNCTNVCDHCGAVRWRHTLYVCECIKATDTYQVGDVVKVGSGCVDAFLGNAAHQLLKSLSALIDWGKHATEKTQANGYSETPHYPVQTLLAHFIGLALGHRVGSCLAAHTDWTRDRECRTLAPEIVEHAMVTYDWIVGEMPRDSTFAENLAALYEGFALCSSDMDDYSYRICAGWSVYCTAHGLDATTGLPQVEPNPTGPTWDEIQKGQRIKVVGNVVKIHECRNGRWLHVVKATSGRVFKWFAAERQARGGDRVEAVGRFDSVGAYNGEQEVTLYATECAV